MTAKAGVAGPDDEVPQHPNRERAKAYFLSDVSGIAMLGKVSRPHETRLLESRTKHRLARSLMEFRNFVEGGVPLITNRGCRHRSEGVLESGPAASPAF